MAGTIHAVTGHRDSPHQVPPNQQGECESVSTTQVHNAANALLTPAEVAAAFRVDPKTVTRWAKAGKLSFIRTLGGHRRYLEAEVLAKLSSLPPAEDQPLWLAHSSGASEGT
jgi:excisionase family DNA binding protein